jgi:predicted oxidoreductase
MVSRAKLSSGGPELSRLVYGTWRVLDDPATATPEHLLRRLEICLERGISTVDTAEIYGVYAVEELLGHALARSSGLRQRLEIVTKCGIYVPCERHPERRVAFYNNTAKRIIASAEKSLRLLKTDYLDLLLIHRPDWLTSADDTAEGLETLLRQGKIRHAGVSNYNVHQLELLSERVVSQPLRTNQIELSLFAMNPLEDGTLDQCQRLRIAPMAWSPLGGGRLFDPRDLVAQRIRAAMATIAGRYDEARPERLALSWVLAHPSRPLAVIGTNRPERIESLASGADMALEREDWYLLWEAARGHEIP